ncbi:ATP-binding protein [Rubritalea spongiae]|uniref:histidine kinase n=1 Tax=Rubritalea spongiae TaxID=430797 RepID=A0ABW5E5Q2_9BACT
MWIYLVCFISLFFLGTAGKLRARSDVGLNSSSLTELENKKRLLEEELGQLASISLQGGMGSVGFRSPQFDRADETYWVRIHLGKLRKIDQIVLSPVLWRDSHADEVIANAFPKGFRVVVGRGNMKHVVAEYTEEDGLLPRVAPLVISFPQIAASWVRIETTKMSPRIENGKYVMQLAEIQVFSGSENVALRRRITTSHKNMPNRATPYKTRFLNDGYVPYVMNSADSERCFPFLGPVRQQPDLVIDLGEKMKFSRIRLHAVEQSNNIPQGTAGDMGIPRRFKIYGADSEDFSDALELLDYSWNTLFDVGPIMEWPIGEVSCRYVKLSVLEPNPAIGLTPMVSRVGFAEIELLDMGVNVALGQRAYDVRKSNRSHQIYGNPLALTDGHTIYGKILPLREWMNQMARRHDLMRELSEVEQMLAEGYARQKEKISQMRVTTVVLVVVIILMMGLAYVMRIHNEVKVRERIAANLHDELGANLHAIGILGDLATDAVDDRDDLLDTLSRIRRLTESTGLAAYRCANMMNAKSTSEDFVNDVKQEASRLLGDKKYTLSFEGEELLNQLSRRRRVDLMLFFKECIVNAIRHAKATHVEITFVAEGKEVLLIVRDNGIGIEQHQPKALARRAKLLRGTLSFEPASENAGLCVTLKFRSKKWNTLW